MYKPTVKIKIKNTLFLVFKITVTANVTSDKHFIKKYSTIYYIICKYKWMNLVMNKLYNNNNNKIILYILGTIQKFEI